MHLERSDPRTGVAKVLNALVTEAKIPWPARRAEKCSPISPVRRTKARSAVMTESSRDMPRKSRSESTKQEYTHLSIRIERYEASIDAGINHDALAPEYAWDLDMDEPLYSFTAQIEVFGTVTYPEERAGEAWEITIYDGRRLRHYLDATLNSIHTVDDKGVHQYRTYRGKDVPVLRAPKGMGHVAKVRGEHALSAWLYASPQFLSDALVLLGQRRMLFMAAHESREGRTRRLQSLSIQTIDPAEE